MLSDEKYTIAASAALADIETRILKHGETFGVFDLRGDVYPIGNDELGIYHAGTRCVSRLELKLGTNAELLLLSSFLRSDNGVLNVELMNPDMKSESGDLRKGSVYLSRENLLRQGQYHERILAKNFEARHVSLPLTLFFAGDFRDIFEVRGLLRSRKGGLSAKVLSDRTVEVTYLGLDNMRRFARFEFAFPLISLSDKAAAFRLDLDPYDHSELEYTITFGEASPRDLPVISSCREAQRLVLDGHRRGKTGFCEVHSEHHLLVDWVERSRDDLIMLTTETVEGIPYPYAGVPWYSTPFGRDGIWTALLCLWANPGMSIGVLRYLASTQAREFDAESEAEPGKIVHEVRSGEMAALKEIPFGRYYGSVDVTPLFVVLAAEYFKRTGDKMLILELWPELERAWNWITTFGDFDGDGFVEYRTDSARGLKQQGWKDSHDSVFHADGSDAEGPIALCEVQAYVYGAALGLGVLARVLGHKGKAAGFDAHAIRLKKQFRESFWQPELGTLALALDGKKRPCMVESSNAGHALFFGILEQEDAEQLSGNLLSERMFSGWGIRTVAKGSARFNPMSYHNGSVWPHDNAIIAIGLARYRCKEAVEKIFDGMFEASSRMTHSRMPELFCGFRRVDGNPPTQYPVACSPQAWAAASVYAFIQALLGIEICAEKKEISFTCPTLTAAVPNLALRGIKVGGAELDIAFERVNGTVAIRVERKNGDVAIFVER